jgi:hypothetical protein
MAMDVILMADDVSLACDVSYLALKALLPLRMSLQKQPIQILYYLTQLQMTSNSM